MGTQYRETENGREHNASSRSSGTMQDHKKRTKKGKEKFSYFEPEYDMNYYRKTMFKHGDFTND